jgi:hypothetical protein
MIRQIPVRRLSLHSRNACAVHGVAKRPVIFVLPALRPLYVTAAASAPSSSSSSSAPSSTSSSTPPQDLVAKFNAAQLAAKEDLDLRLVKLAFGTLLVLRPLSERALWIQ